MRSAIVVATIPRAALPVLPGLLLCAFGCMGAPASVAAHAEYQRRVNLVKRMPGFAALWDFVLREPAGARRFAAHQAKGDPSDFRLDAVNYVKDYWQQGREAAYSDLPLLGRGPFGEAVQIRAEEDPDFRPCLLVPRARLHGSGLDVKGPRRSVSMVVWLVRTSGNHAIAGIWHEGTDLPSPRGQIARVERGQRQYALFAGLAGNPGAAAAHVSENGASSFTDRYARNLAVTPEIIPAASPAATAEQLDHAWTAVGFVFDNPRNRVTAFFNGVATDFWIDQPARHPFYRWAALGWRQAQLRRLPGLQEGEDPNYPPDQFYEPPESRPRSRRVVGRQGDLRVEIRRYEFTEVKVTLRRDAAGKFHPEGVPELVRLRVNPFWFPHDLYAPPEGQGGPFTIGRVIHTSRNVGFTGFIGGVAVFSQPLSHAQMKRLATFGRRAAAKPPFALLRADDLRGSAPAGGNAAPRSEIVAQETAALP
jgi:hypothetical protein